MAILLHSTRLSWPAAWADIYGRDRPLLVEVGFGGGLFLTELAKRRLDCNVLGIEISLPSIRRATSKIEKAELTNIRIVQGSAPFVLQALCKPDSVNELYINFPDPWPKSSHQHRRLINEEFLNLVASRMISDGRLEIATDHGDYATTIADCLINNLWFENHLQTPFVIQDDERIRTKYERSALEAGRDCHYFRWRRNDVPVTNSFPVPKELPMPHVIIHSALCPDEIGREYQSMQVSEGGIHVNLLEAFFSVDGQQLIVDTYVNEAPLEQRVGLMIRQRKRGELVIGLHDIGFPRSTPGIQMAIRYLAEWVASLHPESYVKRSNVTGLETAETSKRWRADEESEIDLERQRR